MTADEKILPVTLNPRKTYILPTRYGFLFLLLLLVMLIGSVNYNNNLGFLLTFLLSSMCVISLYYTNGNLKGIRILAAHARPVFAGDPATFELVIQAKGHDRHAIVFHFTDQPDLQPETIHIDENNRIRRSKRAVKRGVFRPGRIKVSTVYPFGLFRSWSTLSINLACDVYPKPISSGIEFQSGTSLHNGQTASVSSGAEDFQGLAEYQPGDPLRHVSWKKLSAGQGMFTKKFEGLAGSGVIIDWFSIPSRDGEKKLSIMSGMVVKAHQMNLEYGLRLPGTEIEPGSGNRHRHQCLKRLSLFQT